MKLISDNVAIPGEIPATKANIRAVLRLLSGSDVPASEHSELPTIQRVLPNDLLVLTLSTHGYAAHNGEYYCLPADVKDSEKVDKAFLDSCISARELADWIRPIDAGEIVLILDTCHSGAIEELGFKPGPMGSRGLCQLAYDKKMRLLCASQANSFALELRNLQHGLLTYTLLVDGLGNSQADFSPLDGTIFLSEWLSYASSKVPEILSAGGKAKDFKVVGNVPPKPFQIPVFYDFSQNDSDIVLAGAAVPEINPLDVEQSMNTILKIDNRNSRIVNLKRILRKADQDDNRLVLTKMLADELLDESTTPSLDLVRSAQRSLCYLVSAGLAARVVPILISTADILVKRHEYSDIAREYYEMALDFGDNFLSNETKTRIKEQTKSSTKSAD